MRKSPIHLWVLCLSISLSLSFGRSSLSSSLFEGKRQRRDGSSFRVLDELHDQDPQKKIFFWRPQKVGSSTLVNILNTYSFRHKRSVSPKGSKNSFCYYLYKCTKELGMDMSSSSHLSRNIRKLESKLKPIDRTKEFRNADVYLQHYLCNLDGDVTQKMLPCALRSRNRTAAIKQITLLRDPLSRAISVYYFWGELFKLAESKRKGKKDGQKGIGQTMDYSGVVLGNKFDYHGDELTVPPPEIAQGFAKKFRSVFTQGMPGPSLSWSSFSASPEDGSKRFESLHHNQDPQVLPLILERLDESLVILCDYLGWNLADAVFIQPRKHLSSHPKASEWDEKATTMLANSLEDSGEQQFYNRAQRALDERIESFNQRRGPKAMEGASSFETNLAYFRQLKQRSAEICTITSNVTALYQDFLKRHDAVSPCPTRNKLRDVDSQYIEAGHCFILSANTKLYTLSIDLCGSCEAQAIAYSLENGWANDVASAPSYQSIKARLNPSVLRQRFTNCP